MRVGEQHIFSCDVWGLLRHKERLTAKRVFGRLRGEFEGTEDLRLLVQATCYLIVGGTLISCGFGPKPIMERVYEERRSGIFKEN